MRVAGRRHQSTEQSSGDGPTKRDCVAKGTVCGRHLGRLCLLRGGARDGQTPDTNARHLNCGGSLAAKQKMPPVFAASRLAANPGRLPLN